VPADAHIEQSRSDLFLPGPSLEQGAIPSLPAIKNEAVEYCRNNGIEFYAVNKSYPEEIFDETISRKIDADIFIDDRNIGGFPGWSGIWQILNPYDLQQIEAERKIARSKRSIIRRLFNKKPDNDEA